MEVMDHWRAAAQKDIYNCESDLFISARRRTTIDIKTAKSLYKGETEAELLAEMAKATGCRLIYKYANDFGDKVTHTDYVAVMAPGDAQEEGLTDSPFVHNLTWSTGKGLS